MRTNLVAVLALTALSACRGEPPPRDYRNHPPSATKPADTQTATPTAHGMPGARPELDKGTEGKTTEPVEPTDTTGTVKDQAPVTTTT